MAELYFTHIEKYHTFRKFWIFYILFIVLQTELYPFYLKPAYN